jgi:hypothetical protein
MNTACACRLRRHTLGVWTTRSQEDLRRLEDARGTRVSLTLRPLFCSCFQCICVLSVFALTHLHSICITDVYDLTIPHILQQLGSNSSAWSSNAAYGDGDELEEVTHHY